MSQDPIEIVLPAIKANSVYRLDLAVLSCKVCLVKEDNSALDANSLAGIANNGLNSLFSRSGLYLNVRVLNFLMGQFNISFYIFYRMCQLIRAPNFITIKADSFKKVFFFSTHLPFFLTNSTVRQKNWKMSWKKI